MANASVAELRKKTEAAWDNLNRQLQDMEPYMDRADAPGQWTTRQVLATQDLPVIEIKPGQCDVSGWREFMSLGQFREALDTQRVEVFSYLETLKDADLGRKGRIPLFKQIMGNEEVPMLAYVGALYDSHWNDHAAQLAKIRKAMELPEAT
jgi:hypothetical protein